jgi:hypothetical protein
MRKLTICLAVFTLLFGTIGLASAAQNVANTNQKGSLIVFPKIDVSDGRDTLVRIGNDFNSAVRVQCFWQNSLLYNQPFDFILPANEIGWIMAKSGLAQSRLYLSSAAFPVTDFVNGVVDYHAHTGELKCFAVDMDSGVPISFNHLYGSAEIWNGHDCVSVYGYNAWSFTAEGLPRGVPIGMPGQLNLTGVNGAYDACPQFLISEFTSAPIGSGFGTQLTLVPCQQDLRQDGTPVATKAQFEVWDMNGMKTGDAYKCVSKFFDGFLQDIAPGSDPWTGLPIGGYGGSSFVLNSCIPGADNGRFRVTAVKSTVCESSYYYSFWRDLTTTPGLPSPIPGFATYYYDLQGVGPTGSTKNTSFLGVIVKYPMRTYAPMAKTPNTSGIDPTGFLKYDPSSSSPVLIPEFK